MSSSIMETHGEEFSKFVYNYSLSKLEYSTETKSTYSFSDGFHKFAFDIIIERKRMSKNHHNKISISRTKDHSNDISGKLNFIFILRKMSIELSRKYIELSSDKREIDIVIPNNENIEFEIIYMPFTPIFANSDKCLLPRIMSMLSVTPAPIKYQDDSLPLSCWQAMVANYGCNEEAIEQLVDIVFPDYDISVLDLQNGFPAIDISKITKRILQDYYEELGISYYITETSVLSKDPNSRIIIVCPNPDIEQVHPHVIQCGNKNYEIASVFIRESGFYSTLIFNNYLGGNDYYKISNKDIEFHHGYPKLASYTQNSIFALIYVLRSLEFELKYKLPLIDDFKKVESFVHLYKFDENSKSISTYIQNTTDLRLNSNRLYFDYNLFSNPDPKIPLSNPSGDCLLEIKYDTENESQKLYWCESKIGFEPYYSFLENEDDEIFDKSSYHNPVHKELILNRRNYKVFLEIEKFKKKHIEKKYNLCKVSTLMSELVDPLGKDIKYSFTEYDRYILTEFYITKVKIDEIIIQYKENFEDLNVEISQDYKNFQRITTTKENKNKTGILKPMRSTVASSIRITGNISCIDTFDFYGALIE